AHIGRDADEGAEIRVAVDHGRIAVERGKVLRAAARSATARRGAGGGTLEIECDALEGHVGAQPVVELIAEAQAEIEAFRKVDRIEAVARIGRGRAGIEGAEGEGVVRARLERIADVPAQVPARAYFDRDRKSVV